MKPSIPKGTRDFSPQEMVKRNYIFDTIKAVYQKFGFLPIETPALEKTQTLLGKYGEEGDRLIFKIFPRGRKADKMLRSVGEQLQRKPSESPENLAMENIEEALRYDLTVPFARYVVQHQNEITFPFRRYQVQPVWRADRPQKGRYREFYQCDADVIGSGSLLSEVEFVQIIDEVFTSLNMPVHIHLNNRKLLYGIAEVIGVADQFTWFSALIDKREKVGWSVIEEEFEKNIPYLEAKEKLKEFMSFSHNPSFEVGSNKSILDHFKSYLKHSETGLKGVKELEHILEYFNFTGPKNGSISENTQLFIDYTLARGLDYYTGAIIEVKANEGPLQSTICAGGRYDDLTGIFGLPDVSGVGISFGADRIYDVMEELKLFPDFSGATTQVMFINFGEKEEKYCMPLIGKLRKKNINTEIYPEAAKVGKQFGYADKKNIPFVVMVGEEEMNSGQLSLKNMKSGVQEKMGFDDLVNTLSKKAQ